MSDKKIIIGKLSDGRKFECQVAMTRDFVWAQKMAKRATEHIMVYVLTRILLIEGQAPIFEELLELPFADFGRLLAIAQGEDDPLEDDLAPGGKSHNGNQLELSLESPTPTT